MASGRTRKRRLVITKGDFIGLFKDILVFLNVWGGGICTNRDMALGCWISVKIAASLSRIYVLLPLCWCLCCDMAW